MYMFVYTMVVYTFISGLVIFIVFPTCSASGIVHQDSESCCTGQNGKIQDHHLYQQCGNSAYKISESSCCNGEIHQGLSQLVSDCCKSKAFNPLNEICCDGRIFTRNDAQEECCGPVVYLPTLGQDCCGAKVYNKTTHYCENRFGLKVKPITGSDPMLNKTPESTPINISDLKCGSENWDPQKKVCCSDVLFRRSSRHKCCGKRYYPLYDDKVLCCNGILHFNVAENSECVGGLIYAKKHIQLSCGSEVYSPHNESLKCCSGHLYNITKGKGSAECCGTSLLEEKNNQTCCSSASDVLLYQTKSNHSCCGHYYYNTSLWSCCAEDLKPTAKKGNSAEEYRLKPLMDLIPDICKKTVVFGKVEGVALAEHQRLVAFRVVLEHSVMSFNDRFYNTSLNHCSFPALERGMTYIWEKNDGVYIPLSLPVDPSSDINMFFAICNSKPY